MLLRDSDARMLSENSYDKLSVDEVYTFSNKTIQSHRKTRRHPEWV